MLNVITGMPIKKSRELKDIETEEVSLVDRAANKQKFLFFKNDGSEDELSQLLSILELADFDSESDAQITKAVDVLTELEADQRDCVAKTVMAILQISGIEVGEGTELQKANLNWPSFHIRHEVRKTIPTGDDETKWPSLCGITADEE